MRRSRSALLHARALLLAGLVAVAPSTLIGATASAGGATGSTARAAASDRPASRTVDRKVRLHGSAAQTRAGNRPAREVVVDKLPNTTGAQAKVIPHTRGTVALGKSAGPGTKSPSGFPTSPLAPTQATVTTTSPATEGVSGTGLAESTLEPPDAAVAAGPDHVVQMTNEGIRITNRTLGGSITKTLSAFFGIDDIPNYDAVTFDPHVMYDAVHNRWLATEASFDCVADANAGINVGTGYIDVAISDTADPSLGWTVLSVPYPDTVPDYPGLGTSTDKIVLSSNVFDLVATGTGLGCNIDDAPNSLVGTELDVVSWAQMMGTGSVDISFLTSYIAPIDFNNDFFTFRPAIQAPALSSTVFGVGIRLSTAGVVSFKITGLPSSGTTSVSIANVSGIDPFDDLPPTPVQPSGTIAKAVDGRPTDAVWQNNRLVFVSTIGCDPAGGAVENRDCVRVSELSTVPATPTVTQDMLVAETGRDLYMGGIGLSINSDLHVVWTGSSSTAADFPSTYTAYQPKGSTVNTLKGKQKIGTGTANYTGDRWGDYVTVAQDPQVPDAVWQADEHSVGGWTTHVSQLRTFAGASYVPITPLRVLDSRSATLRGLTSARFTSSTPRTFQVTGVAYDGQPAIPASAIAVTGNLTVVNQEASGYASVTPLATSTPTTSTINFPLGDTRANNFTLVLGTGGKLSAVYKGAAGKKADLIVDITGYFVAGSGSATYSPLTPIKRVLDTRDGTGGSTNPWHGGETREVQVAGVGPIPLNATAITGNLTVATPTNAGFLSVAPDPIVGAAKSSTMNFPAKDVRANGLTAVLNAQGKLSIKYTAVSIARAPLVLDVTGYYVAGAGGSLFYPVTPGRPLDSRPHMVLTGLSGVFHGKSSRTLTVGGHWGVPTDATAITGNLTVVGQTSGGFVSILPVAANTLPASSTINFPLGDVRANGVTTPLVTKSLGLIFWADPTKSTNLVLDVTGYFK